MAGLIVSSLNKRIAADHAAHIAATQAARASHGLRSRGRLGISLRCWRAGFISDSALLRCARLLGTSTLTRWRSLHNRSCCALRRASLPHVCLTTPARTPRRASARSRTKAVLNAASFARHGAPRTMDRMNAPAHAGVRWLCSRSVNAGFQRLRTHCFNAFSRRAS